MYMDFEQPNSVGFTVYCKSGCPPCSKVKHLLREKQLRLTEILCDDYIVEEKERFLSFIQARAGTQCATFPMVFYDGRFVGGLAETVACVDKVLMSFEDIFDI